MIHLLLYSRAMERSFPCHEHAPAHDTLLCQTLACGSRDCDGGEGGGVGREFQAWGCTSEVKQASSSENCMRTAGR